MGTLVRREDFHGGIAGRAFNGVIGGEGGLSVGTLVKKPFIADMYAYLWSYACYWSCRPWILHMDSLFSILSQEQANHHFATNWNFSTRFGVLTVPWPGLASELAQHLVSTTFSLCNSRVSNLRKVIVLVGMSEVLTHGRQTLLLLGLW